MIEGDSLPQAPLLTSLHLTGTNVTVLETGALAGLTGLVNSQEGPDGLMLPLALTSIAAGALGHLPSLQQLDLSETQVTRLETGALRGIPAAGTVLLPEGLASIEAGAFDGCIGLVELDLRGTEVVTLVTGAFDGLSKSARNIQVPSRLEVVESGAFRDLHRQ